MPHAVQKPQHSTDSYTKTFVAATRSLLASGATKKDGVGTELLVLGQHALCSCT